MAKKIIIIDDDRKVQEFLHDALANKGYEIHSASNAESGLELIKMEKPDLILVDILLPRQNGISLCEILRSDPTMNRIPIIIMTGVYLDSGMQMSRGLGNDFIKKPISLDELMSKIHKLIE